jgi:hypothetical protein
MVAFFFLFLSVLGIEPRASHVLDKHSVTSAMLLSLVALFVVVCGVFFCMGFELRTLCLRGRHSTA